MRKVEFWQVVAVSKEFVEILRHMPEAVDGMNDPIGGGKRLKVESEEVLRRDFVAIAAKLIDCEHPFLVVERKVSECAECKPNPGEDPNIPYGKCPHIASGRFTSPSVCQSWTLDPSALGRLTISSRK